MPVRGRPTGLGAGGNRGPPARNSRGQGAAVSEGVRNAICSGGSEVAVSEGTAASQAPACGRDWESSSAW